MEGNGKLIIDSILDEANTFAERTVKAAEKDAEMVLAAAKEETNRQKEQILSEAEQELSAIKQRMVAARRLDEKKRMLEQKQALVSQVIDAAVDKITGLPDGEYLSVIERMLSRAVHENAGAAEVFEVIVSPQDKARLGKPFFSAAGQSLSGGVRLVLSEEQRDIGPGFILKAGNVEINCTFAAIVRSDREALEELAARLLFS